MGEDRRYAYKSWKYLISGYFDSFLNYILDLKQIPKRSCIRLNIIKIYSQVKYISKEKIKRIVKHCYRNAS